ALPAVVLQRVHRRALGLGALHPHRHLPEGAAIGLRHRAPAVGRRRRRRRRRDRRRGRALPDRGPALRARRLGRAGAAPPAHGGHAGRRRAAAADRRPRRPPPRRLADHARDAPDAVPLRADAQPAVLRQHPPSAPLGVGARSRAPRRRPSARTGRRRGADHHRRARGRVARPARAPAHLRPRRRALGRRGAGTPVPLRAQREQALLRRQPRAGRVPQPRARRAARPPGSRDAGRLHPEPPRARSAPHRGRGGL
ncbi:MAG: hypothetical protein AVDCRST_MAG38-2863, partial [uncultured Solirubrobacteraceae bacterium]